RPASIRSSTPATAAASKRTEAPASVIPQLVSGHSPGGQSSFPPSLANDHLPPRKCSPHRSAVNAELTSTQQQHSLA
uniref:Uncharacterized protein n=1 Tax=Plectus sambesii TaxID=2011161 RepID=A0A914VVB5_9BILA